MLMRQRQAEAGKETSSGHTTSRSSSKMVERELSLRRAVVKMSTLGVGVERRVEVDKVHRLVGYVTPQDIEVVAVVEGGSCGGLSYLAGGKRPCIQSAT